MEAATELRGPLEVEQALEDAAIELDGLGKSLDAATDELATAEEEWTSHYDATIEDLQKPGDRLPGEEVRVSMARRGDGWKLWTRYRRAERDVKRIEKRITQVANVISAYQSKLRQVRAENGGSY